MVVELSGPGERRTHLPPKKRTLYIELGRVFAGCEGARVACPLRKAELRLRGFDRSLAGGGSCLAGEVLAGDSKFLTKGLAPMTFRSRQ
ncbi:hypothetical protein ACFW04_007455 [Cataglyphis niger]